MGLTRREFLARSAAASVAFTLAAAGCSGSDAGSGNLDGDASWSVEQDDSLPMLTTKPNAGGDAAVIPESCWYPVPEDGYIQLQLTGGSVPGTEIDSVTRSGENLLVTLKAKDGPQTMDLSVTEFRLKPQGCDAGDIPSVETVTLNPANTDPRTLEKAQGTA